MNIFKKYRVNQLDITELNQPLEKVALRLTNPTLSKTEQGRPNTYYVDGKPSGKDSTFQFNYYARGTRGNPGAYWQTYLSDPLVKSSVDSTHEGLVSGSWAVVAPACADDHDLCTEQAAFVEQCLLSKPSSWKEFLRGWTYGDRVYGFSLWEIVDREDGGVAKLAYRRPGTVKRWVFSEDGRKWIGTEFEYEGGESDVYIEAKDLLLYSTGIGLDFEGVSSLRPIVKWTEIKQLITQIETAAAESHGNGYRTIESTSEVYDTADLERIKDVLAQANATSDPIFAFPGYKMDWISPNGKLPDFQGLRNYCDAQIALALQSTGSLVGLGDTGTYALAEVKDQQDIRRYLYFGKSVCDLINEHIVRRIVDTVWGPQDHYPELTFNIGSEAKDPTRLDKIVQFVQTGILSLNLEDQNLIREELGFKPLEEAEQVAEPELSHDCAEHLPKKKSLNLSQKDISDLGARLDKVEKKAAKEAQIALKAMRDAYVARSAGITDRLALRALTKNIVEEFQPVIRDMVKPAIVEMIETGEASALYEMGARNSLSAKGLPDIDSADFALAEADRIADHITNVNADYLESNAVNELESNTPNRAKPPIQTASATESLIAGYTGRSMNEGRKLIIKRIQDEAEARGIKDKRVVAEYSSVLESDTCDICRDLDGERVIVGSARYNAISPPNRCKGKDRCRCIWSYILPSEEGYQEILDSLK